MMGCVKVAVPPGFGALTSLGVVRNENNGHFASWTASVNSGVVTAAASSNQDRVAPTSGNVAISFTTSTTTTGATTWTTSAFNDTACSSGPFNLNGSQPTVTVNAGTLHHFAVTGAPVSTTAGSTFSLTVTAQDAFNNTVTGYTGQIHFSSTDAPAVLPANYTFVGGDNGSHIFTNAVTLKTAGPQTVSVNDTTTPAITGTTGRIAVNPAPAVTFSVSAPASAAAGAAFDLTVTAKDAYNNVATGYLGTAEFTSNDAHAVLPLDYTFLASDNGTHTFFNGAILTTSGARTITATDTVTASITGISGTIAVNPASAATLSVTAPAVATAGTAFDVTVTVKDAFENVVTGYLGTVHFTSSDGSAVLPANYAFQVTDAGAHTFTGGVTLTTAGIQTVTATDTVNGAIHGTSGSILVSAAAAAAVEYVNPDTSSLSSGSARAFTARVRDNFGNTVTGYVGDITFIAQAGPGTVTGLPPAVTVVNGQASTGNLTGAVAGNVTVRASSGSLATADTSFNVTSGAAAAVAFVSPITTELQSGSTRTFTARIRDAAGNPVTGYAGSITFSYQASPGTVTGLPQTVTVVNGQATSGTITAVNVGNVTVRASSGSLATGDTSFTVTPVPVTVSITGGPFTYNGNPHAATVTTTPSITGYSVNYAGTTTAYNSSTPPTNADTYTVTVTITDPNYVLSGSATGSITINKAALTASII